MVLVAGCVPVVQPTILPSLPTQEHLPTEPVTKTPAKVTEKSIELTYVKDSSDYTSSGLYGVDITCMTISKICFGSSHLILETESQLAEQSSKPAGPIIHYAWSPNGDMLALELPGDVWVGDLKTQMWKNLTNSSFKIAEYEPKWSSDGKFIHFNACVENTDQTKTCQPKVVDIFGKEKSITALFRNGDYALSPDGQDIVFSAPNEHGIDRIYRAKLDGTGMQILSTNGDGDIVGEYGAIFSPDGEKILFLRHTQNANGDEMQDMILRDLISGDETNLTDDYNDVPAAYVFSPDGFWIAFFGFDKNLNKKIYLMPLGEKKIIELPDGASGVYPAWRKFEK